MSNGAPECVAGFIVYVLQKQVLLHKLPLIEKLLHAVSENGKYRLQLVFVCRIHWKAGKFY